MNRKQNLKKLRRDEGGAVIVLVAGMMTCMLLLGALAVDLGCAYVRGARLQTAADAAVLSAGQFLPVAAGDTERRAEVLSAAAEYLEKNGISNPSDYDITLGEAEDGACRTLTVTVTGSVPTSFAGVIGVHSLSLTKTAEVQTMVCVRLNDVVPLSVEKSTLEACLASGVREHITLKFGAHDDADLGPGNFGAIDLDGVQGGGANDYSTWLAYGYEGEISVGDDLYPVESGNMAGPTAEGLNARYYQCTHFPDDGGCTAEHYDPNCPRVIKVPVVVYDSTKSVQIVGFAAFVLEGPA
ncbi:MAG TPA: pilus assembly protein TadG-related protein, partial [Oscillospiraceae bacterium]|nr:pilus assembly protein TadG-related protein [Oscillospiraceae bacterium]